MSIIDNRINKRKLEDAIFIVESIKSHIENDYYGNYGDEYFTDQYKKRLSSALIDLEYVYENIENNP